MNYNTWFKRISIAMRLKRHDIVKIMDLAGAPVSSSRADGWFRRSDDKNRAALMTHDEFDVFTDGLTKWAKNEIATDE